MIDTQQLQAIIDEMETEVASWGTKKTVASADTLGKTFAADVRKYVALVAYLRRLWQQDMDPQVLAARWDMVADNMLKFSHRTMPYPTHSGSNWTYSYAAAYIAELVDHADRLVASCCKEGTW